MFTAKQLIMMRYNTGPRYHRRLTTCSRVIQEIVNLWVTVRDMDGGLQTKRGKRQYKNQLAYVKVLVAIFLFLSFLLFQSHSPTVATDRI